jgi:hypothetical protein
MVASVADSFPTSTRNRVNQSGQQTDFRLERIESSGQGASRNLSFGLGTLGGQMDVLSGGGLQTIAQGVG